MYEVGLWDMINRENKIIDFYGNETRLKVDQRTETPYVTIREDGKLVDVPLVPDDTPGFPNSAGDYTYVRFTGDPGEYWTWEPFKKLSPRRLKKMDLWEMIDFAHNVIDFHGVETELKVEGRTGTPYVTTREEGKLVDVPLVPGETIGVPDFTGDYKYVRFTGDTGKGWIWEPFKRLTHVND
jgi:uncharacterized protein YecE (DUF72 family)